MIKFAFVALLVMIVVSEDPPQLPDSFQIAFVENTTINKTNFTNTGQMFYDATHNRERVDRNNGEYDFFCSSVLPRVNTPCTHLTVNDKRYFIYPEKRQCCYCCNSTEGCGILRKDWLEGGHYQGTDQLDGRTFDKWEKHGLTEDYWWVTTDDEHIPRKLQEAESKYTDYKV